MGLSSDMLHLDYVIDEFRDLYKRIDLKTQIRHMESSHTADDVEDSTKKTRRGL